MRLKLSMDWAWFDPKQKKEVKKNKSTDKTKHKKPEERGEDRERKTNI